jgi:acyl transferase domain-containing protein
MQDHDLEYPQTPIAIVGIGCRFPGDVSGPQSFWNFLMAGTDAVGEEIAARRWDMHRYYHPDPTRPGKLYCPRAAFLSAVDQFDAAFFGVPPGEAARMDPQQRILLEVCWEALEDGGLIPQQLAGSPTGVFIGISSNDYGMLQIQDVNSVNAYTNAGQTCSIASNRISYLFDFHGPSFSVDTACSSSMVALHLACESLAKGECSLALAGGVSIVLEPALSVGLSKAYMLSPHGQCRAFDAEANGYVRGEGPVWWSSSRWHRLRPTEMRSMPYSWPLGSTRMAGPPACTSPVARPRRRYCARSMRRQALLPPRSAM